MKLGIVGSRNFTDWKRFIREIMRLFPPGPTIDLIVTGGAAGADTLAELFADRYHIPAHIIKPDWKKYGKSAGMIRNGEIVKGSDIIVAFWDGTSRGTQDTINKAKVFKKTTLIVYV